MNRFGSLLLWLLAWLCASCAAAQVPTVGERHMGVTLIVENTIVAPGGRVALALEMRPDPGWHGYWRNPGDAGAEPRIEWRMPRGWSVAPLEYPVPDRLSVLGLMNYVYEGEYALLTALQAPANVAAGTRIPIEAELDYLVCTDEVCVPEQATVSAEIRVGEAGGESAADFSRYRQDLPRSLASQGRFELAQGKFRLAVPVPPSMSADSPYFYPVTLDAIGHSAPQAISRNGDFLIVETAPGAKAQSLHELEGVLEIQPGLGLSLVARPGPVPAAGTPVATESANAADLSTLMFALLGAVIGGLILNIMPCVFPILSLKALSLARSGESDQAARREALAYAAGVILVCLLLGALLLVLRAAGETAGWAFQLQEPKVILLLLLLVTAIALNLAGLFHLPVIAGGDGAAQSGGVRGAFFTGALAAFVATPCTGPFLGFALGAALVLPAAAALAVFAGLGLGLALPFLLLGFVPALRRLLPRPGPWMERFQRILAVPMFATALGLAWILGRQSGVDGMTLGVAAALLLGLGLWWLGRRRPGRAVFPVAVILVAVLAPLPFVQTSQAPASSPPRELSAEPFSEGRLNELRANGTPVFLYFTADWCLTCKVNEKAALEQSEVTEAFRAGGVAVMVGDWTRGDEAIGRFLERHGRSGVPFYLFYAPGKEAEILPQILTVGRLRGLAGLPSV